MSSKDPFKLWKKRKYPNLLLLFLAGASLALTAAKPFPSASNEDNPPSGAMFHWMLARWEDHSLVCNFFLDEVGEPSSLDIKAGCGEDVYLAWINTPACAGSESNDTEKCEGLFLKFVGWVDPADQSDYITSPLVTTHADTHNCPAWGDCKEIPMIHFSMEGDPALSKAYALTVEIDGDETECDSSGCLLEMPLTDAEGVEVQYWAETPDRQSIFERSFKMRNMLMENGEEENPIYRFDLIGNDWIDRSDVAANIWNVFPLETTVYADWMEYGENEAMLFTQKDYALLAGQLILRGYVDASACENGGLLANNNATECGEKKAKDLVVEWQNRFDQQILQASLDARIPPRILKGLIAQESQFWPFWQENWEFGYGMITENGIDLLLNWNTSYYRDICERYFSTDYCKNGYSLLSVGDQGFLRGVSLLSVGTDAEFILLANILKAACAQTNHLTEIITKRETAEVFSYETLWRITLGVYTSGAGCMSEAISFSWNGSKTEKITWEQIKKNIQPGCKGAKEYFDWVVFYGNPNE